MKIIDHPGFPPVADTETIWKFMDFTKFVAIIESGCLYFNRADQFKDPYEGTLPKFNVPDMLVENLRGSVYVNCWHVNESESAGMWRLYNTTNEGVAIKSNGHRLKSALLNQFNNIVIGKIRYIDYQTQILPYGNVFEAIFHKRTSFSHEQEVRICFENPYYPAYEDKRPEGAPLGMLIKVDLNTLFESVYVSPDAPNWFSELIKKILVRYNLNTDVIHSSLYSLK